ncbi:arylamine N-acetyltransferase [bacterium]|nr:arylamine N-acetyltransferase [bacterium]
MSQSLYEPSVFWLDPFAHAAAVTSFHSHFSIPRGPADRSLLGGILLAFANLPYENLSKIIKHHEFEEPLSKISLPGEVFEGYLESGLGGTCFALTFFLQAILASNGFSCYPVMADMRQGPNTHCGLIVHLDGRKLLADPGYLLNEPLPVSPGQTIDVQTAHSKIRLEYEPDSGAFHLYTQLAGVLKWRYCFRDSPVTAGRFLELWISSFESSGMHGLCLIRSEKGRMVYVHKTHMRESTLNGKKNWNIRRDLHSRIFEMFGIRPAYTERALAALASNLERERESGLWVPGGRIETGPAV